MKKRMGKIMFSLMYCTISAMHPSIQFPPRLGGGSEQEFKLEYYRPVSAVDDGTLSSVIVQGNYKVNGKNIQVPSKVSNHRGEKGERVIGFRGSMQFFPAVNIDHVRAYLDNAQLDHVDERNGLYEAYYIVEKGVLGDKKDVKVSTEQSGVLYQCPMPHEVKVEGHVKTPFVSLESDPVCYGLGDRICQKKRQKAYVHKNNIYPVGDFQDKVTVAPMGEKVFTDIYTHSTVGSSSAKVLSPEFLKYCTYGKIAAERVPMMVPDETAQVPDTTPLVWDVMKGADGNSHLYTYKHYAQCGDKVLRSKPLAWEVEKVSIAIPRAYHMGFKTKEKEPHTDENGVSVIPQLYATKFTQETDKTITMSCVYSDPQHQEDALVLQASLEIPAERCYMYGKDAATSKDYTGTSLQDTYTINKDITVVSSTDKRAEAPVVLHVIPPALKR